MINPKANPDPKPKSITRIALGAQMGTPRKLIALLEERAPEEWAALRDNPKGLRRGPHRVYTAAEERRILELAGIAGRRRYTHAQVLALAGINYDQYRRLRDGGFITEMRRPNAIYHYAPAEIEALVAELQNAWHTLAAYRPTAAKAKPAATPRPRRGWTPDQWRRWQAKWERHADTLGEPLATDRRAYRPPSGERNTTHYTN